jgi:hypothetical protein
MTEKLSNDELLTLIGMHQKERSYKQQKELQAFEELLSYREATDDPEPQADDVETIRAFVEEHSICQEFDIDDAVQLIQLYLSRLSSSTITHKADDAETIRDALTQAAQSLETISRLAGKDDGLLDVFSSIRGYANSRARVAREALARLSAPVDVQAKAEAVVGVFSDTYYELSACQRIELSRLIVEQFSRKG